MSDEIRVLTVAVQTLVDLHIVEKTGRRYAWCRFCGIRPATTDATKTTDMCYRGSPAPISVLQSFARLFGPHRSCEEAGIAWRKKEMRFEKLHKHLGPNSLMHLWWEGDWKEYRAAYEKLAGKPPPEENCFHEEPK